MAAAVLMRCVSPFSYDRDGIPVVVGAGEVRMSNHPDVKGHEALFEPADQAAKRQSSSNAYSAERATAAPGERRVLTSPQQ